MSVADDPRLLATTTPRGPVLPPPAHRSRPPPAHTGRRTAHAGGARDACHASHTIRSGPIARLLPDYDAPRRLCGVQSGLSRGWGTSLAERFNSYMAISRDTLVNIFAKPDDAGGMAVPIRCVNTAEELAEYDSELAQAQDAQRQAEAEATQAQIARMCLAELDVTRRHCDAARLDRAPHITCTNTAAMVNRALVARPATAALAKRTRDSGAPSALTIPPLPTSAAADAESVQPAHGARGTTRSSG